MGWLSKLLSFFQTQVDEKPEQLVLHFNDLEDWLDVKKNDLIIKNKVESEFITYSNKLKAKRWELECNVDEWQKKIPLGKSDEINFFFVDTRKLLDLINLPEDLGLEGILKLNKEIEPLISELIAKIEDSSFLEEYGFLVQDSESKVINPLLRELLEIRGLHKYFEERMTSVGIKTIGNLQIKRQELVNHSYEISRLQKKLKLMADRLQTAEAIKEEKESEFKELQQDLRYQEVGSLESQRDNLRKEEDDVDTQIISFFSKLKPVLVKYNETQRNNLVDSYIHDPSSAFLLDENLNILHSLEHLKAVLGQGVIKVDSLEANTYYELLDKARKGYLDELSKKQSLLHQELEGSEIPLKNKDFVLKVEEARYRVEHFSKQLDELDEKKAGVQEELDDLIELKKRDLGLFLNMVKMGLGKEVEVKF